MLLFYKVEHQASLLFVLDPCGFEKLSHSMSHLMSSVTEALQSSSYSPSRLVSVLSGTPCLICGRGEEARTDAVCFTPATAARRSGSWWTLHPRTFLNPNLIQTHTDVRSLPAALFTSWFQFMLIVFYCSTRLIQYFEEWKDNTFSLKCFC